MTDDFFSSSLRPAFADITRRDLAHQLMRDLMVSLGLGNSDDVVEVIGTDRISAIHVGCQRTLDATLTGKFGRAAEQIDHVTECKNFSHG